MSNVEDQFRAHVTRIYDAADVSNEIVLDLLDNGELNEAMLQFAWEVTRNHIVIPRALADLVIGHVGDVGDLPRTFIDG